MDAKYLLHVPVRHQQRLDAWELHGCPQNLSHQAVKTAVASACCLPFATQGAGSARKPSQ